MKKDGVYYCMYKCDVMCVYVKERFIVIMKCFWLKFYNFILKKGLKY